ncbi:hypothetical protein Tco_1035934 [Tanacetum coccineum]
MSQPSNQAQTPANSTVRNTVGKGSKQTPDRPDIAPRHRHASKRRSASLIRLVEDPQRRRKDTWDLIQSYVTSSSERQREIKEEWDAADHASRMPPALTKELYLLENDHNQGGH